MDFFYTQEQKMLREARLRERAAREMDELKKKGLWN